MCCRKIQRLSAAIIYRVSTSIIPTPLPERGEAKTGNKKRRRSHEAAPPWLLPPPLHHTNHAHWETGAWLSLQHY